MGINTESRQGGGCPCHSILCHLTHMSGIIIIMDHSIMHKMVAVNINGASDTIVSGMALKPGRNILTNVRYWYLSLLQRQCVIEYLNVLITLLSTYKCLLNPYIT